MKRNNKKLDLNNLFAALSAIVMFTMMIVLIVYYCALEKSLVATIILFSIFGLSALSFIIFTVLYFAGTPNLKNKR